MNNPKQQKRKKPLGAAISWDESDLEQMSTVTATDKKAAAALWKNEAPRQYAGLLEATIEEKR